MKHFEHRGFVNDEHSAWSNRGCSSHANSLPRHAAFSEEVTRSQNGNDRLFASFTNDGELYTAFLQVHYALSGITLGVDNLRSFELFDCSLYAGRIEKSLGIECAFFH